MCNDTEMQNGTAVFQAYALVFGSVMTLGLPLNAVALWIFLRRHSLRYTNAVFMVNLAISDLLLVISLPMRVYFYGTGIWPLNDMWCIWITMLFNNNIRSSSIFITFICVDRLLAVVYPLRSRHLRTPSNAWKAAVLVWLLVVVVNVPESVEFSRCFKRFNNQTNNQNQDCCNKSICFEFPYHVSQVDYLQPVLVFTMLAINVVCTTMVSWTLHRQRKDSAKVNNKVNVMLIFVMNLVMFTVFFLPVSLTPITPMQCLASVNCCLDPLLYYFSFDGFWKKKEDVDTSLAE